MTDYLLNRASKHKVKHEFSGKRHFYSVESTGGNYSVALQMTCDCRFMSVQGIANGKICSHILAVIQDIIKYTRTVKNGNGNKQDNSCEERMETWPSA